MELAQKHAINEKSTIIVQNLWNFVKLTHAWVGQIGKVSLSLDKNCGFFINSMFFCQFHFLFISLYFFKHTIFVLHEISLKIVKK